MAMEIGASIFFTDYSITPAELGIAMEERGFDSVWAAEHSHIPVPRRTRADTELAKRYYDVMDPFVTLTAAACATKRLKIATGMQKMREQIEAMKEIWTKPKPEYHGDIVEFDTMMTWPKPVQKPYPPI